MAQGIVDKLLGSFFWISGIFWVIVASRLILALCSDWSNGLENELLHIGNILIPSQETFCDKKCALMLVYRALGGWALLTIVVVGLHQWRRREQRYKLTGTNKGLIGE